MGENLTEIGRIVDKHINNLSKYYHNVSVDKYVSMPNHIHMIIIISEEIVCDNANALSARMNPCPTLGNIIGAFKAGVSREIHKSGTDIIIWQNRFYDHVIKNQDDYENVWTYIDENPVKWEDDEYY